MRPVQQPAPAMSLVVPVYNEVPASQADCFTPKIQALLALLRPCDEIILVDGHSSDASWPALLALAQEHAQIASIQSGKGRARQMNAGAAIAKGEVFLFLHADTVLSALSWNALLQGMATRENMPMWGRFDVRIEGRSAWLPVVSWFINHRSRLSKICTGDQAVFVSRDLFAQVGNFPDQPLMEDIEFCKRLKHVAPESFLPIRVPVITSGRRWDTHGTWKTILLMWRFRFQYWRGASASELASQYADTREKQPLTVAVFAKYPQAGRVKTRLEPLLGAEQCAEFARYLLLSTLDKFAGLPVVLWTDGGAEEQWIDLLKGLDVPRHAQPHGHLGVRMQTAVEMHLKQSQVVVLLGPDAVEFCADDLKRLVRAANEKSIALVPAFDGGYVAMACTQCVPEVFSGTIQWGTGSVAEQTRSALHVAGIQAHWFDAQLDIDEPEDLQQALTRGCVPVDWVKRYSHRQGE